MLGNSMHFGLFFDRFLSIELLYMQTAIAECFYLRNNTLEVF